MLKITCGDIAICTSAIPKNYEDQYRALYDKNAERSLSMKRSHTHIDDALMTKQSLAVANLLEKHGVVVSGGAASSYLSTSIHSAPSVQSFCWKLRVPVRHLSSSSLLECHPNELTRGHFRGASKYSVAIKRFVYFIT